MRILDASQMREADRRTIEDIGIPSIVLMENAGQQVVSAMHATFDDLSNRRIGVLCGCGNNGGDGLVVARSLWQQGIEVEIFLFGRATDVSGDAAVNLAVARNLGLPIVEVAEDDETRANWEHVRSEVLGCDLLVDAILGTGLNRAIDGLLRSAVDDVNASEVPVVSIDLPSGLSADSTTPMGEAFEADVTVTLAAPKPALLMSPAELWAGDLVIADIGIPISVIDDLPGGRLEVITPEEVGLLVPPRHAASHKGDFGHVLIVAGSVGKTGAARLAALGALRSGAGLVTVATPRSCLEMVALGAPEFMTLPLEETPTGGLSDGALEQILDFPCDVIAPGPGLGTHAGVASLIRGLLERSERALVLDADALNVLADEPDTLRRAPKNKRPVVVTPHPGEMGRLIGMTSAKVQADRVWIARHFATDYGVLVVLKGAQTVVASPDGTVWLNLTGNAGMASGGVGDVLTGVTAAWLGQLGHPEAACRVAVYLHGLAGDLAADGHGEAGLIASDVVDALPQAETETMHLDEASGTEPPETGH